LCTTKTISALGSEFKEQNHRTFSYLTYSSDTVFNVLSTLGNYGTLYPLIRSYELPISIIYTLTIGEEDNFI